MGGWGGGLWWGPNKKGGLQQKKMISGMGALLFGTREYFLGKVLEMFTICEMDFVKQLKPVCYTTVS